MKKKKFLRLENSPPLPAASLPFLMVRPEEFCMRKVTFANKLSSSLKIFVDKRNKIQLGLDNTYPENNQRVPRQR